MATHTNSSEKQKPNEILDTVDIGIFYGLRALMTAGVVLIHAIVFGYHSVLPSSMLQEQDPQPVPWSSAGAFFASLLGSSITWLFRGGIHVFWFISGFLIAYKLYFLPRNRYHYFIFNRLLRFYPLYILQIVLTYSSGYLGCNSLWDICRSLLFMDNFVDTANPGSCSGVGWSLSPEMHACFIIVALFYVFDPIQNKTKIIYALCAIFIASWIAAILMFDVYCRPYLRFDDFEAHLIRVGIDYYYPQQMKQNNAPLDPFAHIEKSVYDPDDLNAEQIRNQHLYNNYLTSLYFPTHTQIGASLFGAITFLQLLSIRKPTTTHKYICILMFFVANFCLQCLYPMVDIYKEGHVQFFTFTDSVFTSILMGSVWKIGALSLFCGMNMLLRWNNKFINAALNNTVTRFLSKYSYGICLVHSWAIFTFMIDDEFKKSVYASDGYDGSVIMSLFGKAYAISLGISMVLYHVVEYPFNAYRKRNKLKQA